MNLIFEQIGSFTCSLNSVTDKNGFKFKYAAIRRFALRANTTNMGENFA